jgi:hypothetical protein
MSESDDKPPVTTPDAPHKPDEGPGKADVLALGIGCLVVVLFFVGIVIAGMMRE